MTQIDLTQVRANYRKVQLITARMHRLGKKYRATVPKERRSMSAWLRFLKREAPRMKGL